MWLVTAGGVLLVIAGLVFWGFGRLPQAVAGVFFIIGGILITEGLLRRHHLLFNVEEDEARTTEKLKAMIDAAQRFIYLTTGAFHHAVYGQLEEVLRRKLENHVEVEIVSGENLSPESEVLARSLAAKYKNFRFHVYPGNPSPHGILVDDKRLRVERPHEFGAPVRSNVYVTNPSVGASLFMKRFGQYKSGSQPLISPKASASTKSHSILVTETVTESEG